MRQAEPWQGNKKRPAFDGRALVQAMKALGNQFDATVSLGPLIGRSLERLQPTMLAS